MTALLPPGALRASLPPTLPLAPSPSPGRAGGRPSKLTEGVAATICEGLRTGLPGRLAAERAGVSRAAYYAWLARGDADAAAGLETPYLEFATRARQARAQLAFELCRFLRQNRDRPARSYDVRSVMWTLERLFPEDFVPKRAARRAAHPDPWAVPTSLDDLVADVRAFSDEELERLAEAGRRAGVPA